MVAKIYQYAGAEDLKTYLNAWAATDPLGGHGVFYDDGIDAAYEQWAGGNETGRSANSVLLEGNFTYPSNGGFAGTLDSLDFGVNLSGYPSGPFDITGTDLKLHIDLGGASANSVFNFAIYQLMGTSGTASAAGLYTYLGTVGTEQYGTIGDDTQYSFAGSDKFFGDAGEDTFVFLDTNNGADTISDFVIGDDLINFSAVTAFSTLTDVQSAVTANAAGEAVITWAGGSVTLTGHAAATFNTDFTTADILV